jgi:hypothetical protein
MAFGATFSIAQQDNDKLTKQANGKMRQFAAARDADGARCAGLTVCI